MHKLTPAANALMELARRKVNYKGGRRFIKPDGTLNANALSEAMEDAGYYLPQPTISRLLKGTPSNPKTVRALAGFFGVKEAVVRGELSRIEAPELSADALMIGQSFDEMPLSLRQFLTDVRDAWVRLKNGDPFLAEQVLDIQKLA